ncbi:MAG: hypothetical protein H7A52_16140 [Akkermansiaceae bacterium]|nr:hypothetical protein [Akkermansiaceae bacterium]
MTLYVNGLPWIAVPQASLAGRPAQAVIGASSWEPRADANGTPVTPDGDGLPMSLGAFLGFDAPLDDAQRLAIEDRPAENTAENKE